MKKLLTISVAFNVLIVLFIAGKRYYYSVGPGAGANKVQPAEYDQWDAMRNSLYDNLEIDSTDIVFVGNSLTEGFPVTELFGSHVKNRGIGGNRTKHILNRIGDIAKAHPKKVFIEGGVNDINSGYSTESILKNYDTIVSIIRACSPRTEIYVQSLIPVCMTYENKMTQIIEVNNRLYDYCNVNKLKWVDLFRLMLNGNSLDSSLTGDGLHLNGKGYGIWTKAVGQYIN